MKQPVDMLSVQTPKSVVESSPITDSDHFIVSRIPSEASSELSLESVAEADSLSQTRSHSGCDDDSLSWPTDDTVDTVQYWDGSLFHERFVIGTKINEGGFGSVWRLKNDATKCVKVIDLGVDDVTKQQRTTSILNEYIFTAEALPTHSVELYLDDIDTTHHAKAFLVLPYIDGRDLYDIIGDDHYFENVPIDSMLDVFYKILLKLSWLHSDKQILHGDLKPENVMIFRDDFTDDIEVELIDYGVAQSLHGIDGGDEYLKTPHHFGTKGYIAPELVHCGVFDDKADVFSAGVILYNMVTGCTLFPDGSDYHQMDHKEYDGYLDRQFKCLYDRNMDDIIDLLHCCLIHDVEHRPTAKQLVHSFFH